MNHPMLSNNDLFRLGIVDDRDFYDIALFRNFAGRWDDRGAERSQLFARLFAQIANRQLEAGSGDIRGHGLSHRAEAYKANLRFHKFSYLKSCTSNKDLASPRQRSGSSL
jgi:hypothetical protein